MCGSVIQQRARRLNFCLRQLAGCKANISFVIREMQELNVGTTHLRTTIMKQIDEIDDTIRVHQIKVKQNG